MTQLANDDFGRTVMFDTDGVTDTYHVTGLGDDFTITEPAGTSQDDAYNTINSMGSAPSVQSKIERLQGDLDQVYSDLNALLNDTAGMSQASIQTAIDQANDDSSDNFSTNQADLNAAIATWLLNGG